MAPRLLIFLAFILPATLMAQPVLTNVEGYSVGDTFLFGNAPIVAPGSAGALQTWDFSALTTLDTVKQWVLANPAGSTYPAATIMGRYSDSTYVFAIETAGSVHLTGYIDSSSGGNNDSIGYPMPMLEAMRTIAYTNHFSENFTVHTTYSGANVTGSGISTLDVDGYGTLILPSGSYQTLRVKSVALSTSSVSGLANVSENQYSYIWYSQENAAPLLRIDSVHTAISPITGGTTMSDKLTVRFLLNAKKATGIATTGNTTNAFTANITDNELSLFGVLQPNELYQITLTDLNGVVICNKEIIAGNGDKIMLDHTLAAGMYLVGVATKNNPAGKKVIKAVKF